MKTKKKLEEILFTKIWTLGEFQNSRPEPLIGMGRTNVNQGFVFGTEGNTLTY